MISRVSSNKRLRVQHKGRSLTCGEALKFMEVFLRRRCCVGCNTEAVAPPQPLHSVGNMEVVNGGVGGCWLHLLL